MNSTTYLTPFWIKDESETSANFTVKILNDGQSDTPELTIYYSTDATNWSLLGNTVSGGTLSKDFSAGSKIYLSCTTNSWAKTTSAGATSAANNNRIGASKNFSVGGNIMSLIYGTTFADNRKYTTFPDDSIAGIFGGLFYNQSIVNAEELVLPVTHSTSPLPASGTPLTGPLYGCYRRMFENCVNLVNGPHIDLRDRGSLDLPYCFQRMFAGCTSLISLYINTVGANYRYNSMFSNNGGAEGGICYDYSGGPLSGAFPTARWTRECRPSLYFGYDRVWNWNSSVSGDVDQVVDNNNILIYKKYNEGGQQDPNYIKDIIDNVDKTTPSDIGPIKIKNISTSPATLTMTLVDDRIYDDYPDDRPELTVKDNSGNAIPCVFSPSNRRITATIAPGEAVGFSTSVSQGHMYSYIGSLKPICKIRCTQPYIIVGSATLDGTARIPFTPAGDPNCWDASSLTYNLSINVAFAEETDNTPYQSLFASCSNLIYPADLKVTSAVRYSYMYDRCYKGCTNLLRVMTQPIKVPSTIYNLYMCRETYFGCENLVNADNAIVFGIAGYTNKYADNTVDCDYVNSQALSQILCSTCVQMFAHCTKLKYARFSLPWAQAYSQYGTLYRESGNAYNYMFDNCRNLIEPPKLERVANCNGTSAGGGGTLSASWYEGFGVGNYRGLFHECYNLQKLILIVKATDYIRWYVPSDEYADRGNTSGADWYVSSQNTSTREWMTVGNNPWYGIDPDAIEDNQTGTVYYYARYGYEPVNFGNANNGYLPNGWTLQLRS